jgi:predicted Na+-dependent transporter
MIGDIVSPPDSAPKSGLGKWYVLPFVVVVVVVDTFWVSLFLAILSSEFLRLDFRDEDCLGYICSIFNLASSASLYVLNAFFNNADRTC